MITLDRLDIAYICSQGKRFGRTYLAMALKSRSRSPWHVNMLTLDVLFYSNKNKSEKKSLISANLKQCDIS